MWEHIVSSQACGTIGTIGLHSEDTTWAVCWCTSTTLLVIVIHFIWNCLSSAATFISFKKHIDIILTHYRIFLLANVTHMYKSWELCVFCIFLPKLILHFVVCIHTSVGVVGFHSFTVDGWSIMSDDSNLNCFQDN